jgi:hypothetical protein
MTGDPIVNEVRKYREEYAARFNYDIRRIVKDTLRRARKAGRRTVSHATRPRWVKSRTR